MTMQVSGTSGFTFPDNTTQATAASGFGFKNRIINGAMMIDQRNAGASVTNGTSDSFPVDRVRMVGSQSSKFTAQRSTTAPAGFINSVLVTSSSAYSVGSAERFIIGQYIEGLNVADLGWGTASASTVTLSFWVRSSLTGTFGGAIRNSAGDRSYPFSYTISAANTWEQKSVTIAGDTSGTWLTDNNVGINAAFNLGSGSTLLTTAGAWAAGSYFGPTSATSIVGTNGATFYITGVQLEKGSIATSFDYRPYGTELALCQRYYWKDTGILIQAIAQASSYDGFAQVFFPVPMRATPSCTSLTGGSTFVRNIANGPSVGIGTGTVNGAYTTKVEYLTQASGGSGGAGMGIVGYVNGTGTASAEL